MSTVADTDFPRGGKRVFRENNKRKHDENLFSSEEQKRKKAKKSKKVKKNTIAEDSWLESFKLHGTLTYNKMQSGMTVLGCVRRISNLAIQVEFPGLTFGQVTINRISDSFTNNIASKLKESDSEESCSALKNMFKLGQLVPVKVLDIKSTEKGRDIQGSINPKDINVERIHSSFKKGDTVWANIVSELDHGFELSVGVKDCRVFLPQKNVDSSKQYSMGEPLFCVIHKVQESSVATTLTVSAKMEHLDKIQMDSTSLDRLIPGTKVELVVEEILPNGIKGKFFNNFFGYVDETQIFFKVQLSKVRESSILPAYVLYTEPITKVTYLTLRNLEDLPGFDHEIGKVLSADVISALPKGLYLKLGKNETGFVANKRLLNTLPKSADLDIIDAIKKKYPIGSRHSCRVLDYNRMQQLYICTLEQTLIKEKVFTAKDLKVGESVVAKVERNVFNGLVVSAGHVKGFVPNLHISNTKYTDNIKGKYVPGMTVNARILDITEDNNILFTFKQGLIESDNCLMSVQDAKIHSQYTGFIVQTKISGALVAFFGNAKGWISNKSLNAGNSEAHADPREYFFRGQVVNVWVLGFKDDRLQLSLHPPSANTKNRSLRIGEKFKGMIVAIHSDNLEVEVGQHRVLATVPVAHLCNNLLLGPVLLKTYKIGDIIENLVCLKNTGLPILSKREFHIQRIPRFGHLRKGMVLRCSFESDSSSGINVYTPMLDYHENILIPNQHLHSQQSYQKHQLILAKVLSVDQAKKTVVLDVDVEDSFNEEINSLTQDIEDIQRIQSSDINKLVKFKLGERVQCKVIENGQEECLVTLPNGINGIVTSHLTPFNVQKNDAVQGVVIDYNFIRNSVDICLRNDVKQKINKIQDGTVRKSSESCIAEILLVTKLYVLAVLKEKNCNRQLAYLPLSSVEKCLLQEGDKVKVVLHKHVGSRIIGVPKKLLHLLNKEQKIPKSANSKKKKLAKENLKSDSDLELMTDNKRSQKSDEEIGAITEISDEGIEDSDEEVEEGFEVDDEEMVENNSNSPRDDDEVKEESSKVILAEELRKPILPGVKSFYNPENESKEQESSSDEEIERQEQNRKKKKLAHAERVELIKKEEERISKIENELADLLLEPQTAEHFDRLLLANPNSSELWLKYMAMHMASVELEKARTIARKALETISISMDKEKFNVWVGLLNLENMYGTTESFEKTFEEAVKYNDLLEIYLAVINILASSGKITEMEEKIKKIRSKEKQNTRMWLEIGKVYYSLEKFKEARDLKQAALKSILEKKRQFDLIVKFAIMEFQLGDLKHAIDNFEAILELYPSKIVMWTVYVDQLVKKKEIAAARQVLERAVGQKFPIKSMRAAFQKYITFEEQHGSPELVEEIKKKAKNYVNKVGGR